MATAAEQLRTLQSRLSAVVAREELLTTQIGKLMAQRAECDAHAATILREIRELAEKSA